MNLSNPKRRGITIAAFAAAMLAIVGGTIAYAHSNGGHHGPNMAGRSSDDQLERVRMMLSRVGATEAQKAQVQGILKPALDEVSTLREEHSTVFRQFHETISAPSIDRARLESLRAEQLKSLDEASRRLVTAISDAAEVLSPDQRAALAKAIESHHRG